MTDINLFEGSGGVTKSEVKELPSGATVCNFTLAVRGADYDRQAREDRVITTFVSCERWLPTDYTEHDILYKGDGVYLKGELQQVDRGDGKGTSTRVKVNILSVQRRGREFAARTGNMPAATRTAPPRDVPPAPVDDPWATS